MVQISQCQHFVANNTSTFHPSYPSNPSLCRWMRCGCLVVDAGIVGIHTHSSRVKKRPFTVCRSTGLKRQGTSSMMSAFFVKFVNMSYKLKFSLILKLRIQNYKSKKSTKCYCHNTFIGHHTSIDGAVKSLISTSL